MVRLRCLFGYVPILLVILGVLFGLGVVVSLGGFAAGGLVRFGGICGCLSFVGCCIEFRFDTVVYCCLWLGAFGLLCWFMIFGCVSVVSVVA